MGWLNYHSLHNKNNMTIETHTAAMDTVYTRALQHKHACACAACRYCCVSKPLGQLSHCAQASLTADNAGHKNHGLQIVSSVTGDHLI